MKPVHWYHMWVGDHYHTAAWEIPAEEHFGALINAEFDGEVYVGLVGGLPERAAAMKWLRGWWPESEIVVQSDEGFEQVTIGEMHKWCKWAREDVPVYYAHGKGSLRNLPGNRDWRMAMDKLLIGTVGKPAWKDCVNSLHTYDAVGCHWLTHEQYPEDINPRAPMFGGNFWWANSGYLAKLGEVQGTPERPPVTRWGAEGWVGTGFPSVLDLKPGWPDYPHEEDAARFAVPG